MNDRHYLQPKHRESARGLARDFHNFSFDYRSDCNTRRVIVRCDVLYVKGVDVLTQASICESFLRSNECIGPTTNKIVYIAKLFKEEVHPVPQHHHSIEEIDTSGRPM